MQLTTDHLFLALAVVVIGVPAGYAFARSSAGNLERYRRFSTKDDLIAHLEGNEIQSPVAAVVLAVLLVAFMYMLVVGVAGLLQLASRHLG